MVQCWFGDASCDPVDHPDLVGIHITTSEGVPDGRHTCGGAAGAGEQAAHLVGLITQQQRQLVGHKLTRLRTFRSLKPDVGASLVSSAIRASA